MNKYICIIFSIMMIFYLIRKYISQNIEIKRKYSKNNNILPYEENINLIGVNRPIGYWTQILWHEKKDLIKLMILNYDHSIGYYQNLVMMQKYLRSVKDQNFTKI